jgi:hypothetical protein
LTGTIVESRRSTSLDEPDTCDGKHWAGCLWAPAETDGRIWRIPNGAAGAPEIKYCPECGKRLAVPG